MRIWLQVSFLNVYRKLSRTNWDDDLNITQRTFIYFTGWNCQPVMVTFRHCFLAPTKPQTHTDTHSLNHSFETKTWKWSRWPLRNFKQHKNGIAAVAPGCFRGLVWNLSPWGMRVLNDVNCLIIFLCIFFCQISLCTMYHEWTITILRMWFLNKFCSTCFVEHPLWFFRFSIARSSDAKLKTLEPPLCLFMSDATRKMDEAPWLLDSRDVEQLLIVSSSRKIHQPSLR